MNVTDEMVTDAMNTYLHISPEGVNTAGLRAVLEQALAAQPAPGVGGDARDGFDLVDDLVIATMSMCAGQAGEHAAAECKAEIIRRLVRLSELEASVAQPAPISGDWDENAVMQAAYEIGGTEDGNYYFDEDELQKFAAQLLSTRPAESVAQGGEWREKLQRQCSEWGAYWRAADAHGVELTEAQAIELLAEVLGVEVEIKEETK